MSNKTIELERKQTYRLPAVPNFIGIHGNNRDEVVTVSIVDFSEEDLRIIGKAWTDALVESAKNKRKLSCR